MGIHLNLSSEQEAYLKSKVDSGFYGNVTEVIRAAIRHLQERDVWIALQQSRLEAKVQQGHQDIRDRAFDVLTREKMDDIYAQSMDRAFSEYELNPDVLPASLFERHQERPE